MFKALLTARLAHVQFRTGPDAGEGGSGGGPAPTPTPTPAGSGDAGKTFTQAELDAMFEERLARDRKAREAEAKTKADREKMDAEARAQAEKKDAEDRALAAEARALRAERKANLTGQVIDPEAAMKLLDETKHLDKDGNVKVAELIKDFPFLAPVRTQTPGAGGVQGADAPDTSTLAGALAADGIKL